MTVLTERKSWRRVRKNRRRFELAPREKANVRRRLEALRIRLGNWKRVAEHLGLLHQHVRRLASRRSNPTPAIVFRIARAERVSVAAVLSGARWGTDRCPMCGALRA